MLVRVAPIMGLGLLALILGYQLARLVPVAGRIYLQAVFLGLLFGMVILDTEPGWNMVLFLGFSVAAGIMLHWSEAKISQPRIWILFSLLVLISITGGVFLKRDPEWAARLLFTCTLLYVIGWTILLVTSLPEIIWLIWTVLGLMLFPLIFMAAINRGKSHINEDCPIPLSLRLFVVLYNLYWLSSLLWLGKG